MTTVSLKPAKCDLELYAGEDNTIVFEFPDTEDYTGETWTAQVRDTVKGTLLASATVEVDPVDTSHIVVTFAEADVDTLFETKPVAYWDMERDGEITVFYGSVRTHGDVTA